MNQYSYRKIGCLFMIILISMVAMLSSAHANEKLSHSINGNVEKWRIDEPNVNQPRTGYTQIKFGAGDMVSFYAGGVVNTGGIGDTCKHYVHPSGDNSDIYYHGQVLIPSPSGIMPADRKLNRFQNVMGKTFFVGGSKGDVVGQYLVLGYEDDDYGDNTYEDFDEGNYGQCVGYGPAFVIVWINRYLYFQDDFGKNSGMWTYLGNARRDPQKGYLVLTENKNLQSGAIWLKEEIKSPFSAEFKYKSGGGSGGDGLVFMFYKKGQTGTPPIGSDLGFFPGSGYGIEFDNYNSPWKSDTSENHIALIKDNTGNHLNLVANDPRTEDNKWHKVKVTVSAPVFVPELDVTMPYTSFVRVYIDGELVLTSLINLDKSGGTYGGVGFSAATGGQNNWHIIDDFSIKNL